MYVIVGTSDDKTYAYMLRLTSILVFYIYLAIPLGILVLVYTIQGHGAKN